MLRSALFIVPTTYALSLGLSQLFADDHAMLAQGIKGSFGCGGITGYFVDMLEEGYFRTLFDVQCFDLRAVESIGKNIMHREISADLYANPFNRGSVVNMLDCVILGATEVDVDFNVNVNTESNGYLLHNTGGHSDTAALDGLRDADDHYLVTQPGNRFFNFN